MYIPKGETRVKSLNDDFITRKQEEKFKKHVSKSKNMGILYVPCKKCGGFPQLDFISDGEEFVRFECSCCDNSSGEVEIDPEEGLDRCIEKALSQWCFENKA